MTLSLDINGGEEVDIILGETTTQDLFVELGDPVRRYFKDDERIARMWGVQSDTGGCGSRIALHLLPRGSLQAS